MTTLLLKKKKETDRMKDNTWSIWKKKKSTDSYLQI